MLACGNVNNLKKPIPRIARGVASNGLFFLIIDGITAGDDATIGNCPSSYNTYKCLSNGACNICGLNMESGYAEGCDIHSNAPVCDADSTAAGIQDSATGKLAQCVPCKKSGKGRLFGNTQIWGFKRL